MGLIRTTHPTTTIVATSDVKQHLRIDIDDDDVELTEMIHSAESYCERTTGRQFLTATYTYTRDCFPTWEMDIPYPPLQSVSAITYVDSADGSTVTLASSLYKVSTNGVKGRITPAYNEVWPTPRYEMDAVKVTYIAGATASSDVPRAAHHAVKLLVGHWYANRGAVVTGTITQEHSLGVKALLDRITVGEYV